MLFKNGIFYGYITMAFEKAIFVNLKFGKKTLHTILYMDHPSMSNITWHCPD